MVLVGFVLSCATSKPPEVHETPAAFKEDILKDVPKTFVERLDVKTLTPESEAAAASVKSTKKTKRFKYPNRRPPTEHMPIGEKSVYDISFFGVSAGTFTLETMPLKEVAGRKVYHVVGVAQSSAVFSLFYRLRDTVQSYIDYEGLFSHRFQLEQDESSQTRKAFEINDHEKGETLFWNRWKHVQKDYVETKEIKPIQRFAQDTVSALFYARLTDLKEGANVKIPVISEAKVWEAELKVVRKETLNTALGRLPTLVVMPETRHEGVLKKTGDSYLWLTDDPRKLLVRMEAKIKIGSVIAAIKEFDPGESARSDAQLDR